MEATRVLIVDDDPVIQLLLKVHFQFEGFVVSMADDGDKGLEVAQQLLPDIILLDVMMPKLDGYEVLTRLRSDPHTAHLPVVLLSAKSQPGDRQAGLNAGANAYITKPFEPIKLLIQVKEVLAVSQGTRTNR